MRRLVLMLNVVNKKNVNKMAVNAFNRSVLALLWQSWLKENGKITQNRKRRAQRLLNRYFRRRRLVSFLFFMYLFVVVGLNQDRSCSRKRRAKVGMNEIGLRTSECLNKHSIVYAWNFLLTS